MGRIILYQMTADDLDTFTFPTLASRGGNPFLVSEVSELVD